jgi:hypothetical protein
MVDDDRPTLKLAEKWIRRSLIGDFVQYSEESISYRYGTHK